MTDDDEFRELAMRIRGPDRASLEHSISHALSDRNLRIQWVVKGPGAADTPSARCLSEQLEGLENPTVEDVRAAFVACQQRR